MRKSILAVSLLLALILGVAVVVSLTGVADFASAQEMVDEIPFAEEWAGSGHNDAEAEAFVHWDEDDPAEVPENCAKCHSTSGYLDYHGVDGSEFGVVDAPVPIGETVTCVACHNEATGDKDSVIMPSGIELTGLGSDARCMECHQGRQSKVSVDASIEEAGVDDDTVSEDLGFANIHYYAAAASKYGTLAKGGYEYEGMAYDGNFAHVTGFETCESCHDSHTLELKVEECTACHENMTAAEDAREVRMAGSLVDYDGDGDMDEGLYYEVEGLRDKLFEGIQAYADEVAGAPIAYGDGYPYFFVDTNANGEADEDEQARENAYNAWTPRLVKAAYNYQSSLKDPGAYVHGGKYHIQLIYDSIMDLNVAVSTPIDMEGTHRIDHGHFAGSEEAFRHWDEDGEVEADCARCHSAEGLPIYLKDGANISAELSNGLQCESCHNDLVEYTLYEAPEVEFPSGAVVDSGSPEMNLCMNCHQGRSSGPDVDAYVEGLEDDTVDETLGFQNVHYFAAAATIFGDDVQAAYQYPDKEYFGWFQHDEGVDTCTGCHSAHMLTVKAEKCGDCHDGVETVEDALTIREYSDDWDGDGDTDEGIAGELDTMSELLYAEIQNYADGSAGTPIVYESHTYPYFFLDTDGDGEAGPEEANYGNKYNAWTPRLLKAAFNYQYAQKDPGAYAHNGQYVLQALHDSIEDLGGDVSGMTRP
jgi:hypothetical protein